MDTQFYTLQDFMLHTEAVTYILIVAALIGIGLFWQFLCAKDRE